MSKTLLIRTVLALALSFMLVFPAQSQSLDWDKQLGAQNAEMVEVQMGIYPDDAMNAYVNKVGQRLVAELKDPLFDYQFHVVDDPIPNAFALPGGYIYVTRGILSLMISEDELACVMGHEVIHALKRHSIQQMKSSILPRMLELPGKIIGNVVSEDLGNLLNAPIKTSNDLLLASYSRGHETESDVLGVQLAAKAGYNPNAMKDILARLSSAVEVITDEPEKKSYFNDHPFTPDRLDNITETTKKFTWTETTEIAPDFPNPIHGLVFGYNPSKGVFKENVFMHPELKFTLVYPEGWITENLPTSVNGMNEEQNTGIFLGFDNAEASMEDAAKDFIQRVEKEYKIKPSKSEHTTVNGADGYLVTFVDNTEKQDMHIYVLWLRLGEHLFKLIGLAPNGKEAPLVQTAQSLRLLKDKEIDKMTKKVVLVEELKSGETLEAFCKRTSSVFKPEAVALINGFEVSDKLPAGKKIKVIKEVSYKKVIK